MSELFLCSTHCESCAEKEICPMKDFVSENAKKKLDDYPDHIREAIIEASQQIDPEELLKTTKVSVFNILQAAQFLFSEEKKIATGSVYDMISSEIKKNKQDLDIEDEELVFGESTRAKVLFIAQRICDAIKGQCDKSTCSSCCIAKECGAFKEKNESTS